MKIKKTRQILSLLLVFITILTVSTMIGLAQNAEQVFFLAVNDQDKNGEITSDDPYSLWSARIDGSNTRPLSKEGQSVFRYTVNADSSAYAYGYIQNGQQGVTLVTATGDFDIPLNGLSFPRLNFSENALWIVGEASDGTETMRGFSLNNASIVGEQQFSLADSTFILDPKGQAVIGYNSVEGILAAFNLPDFNPITLDLSGLGLSQPVWHPQGRFFAIAISDSINTADLAVLIFDTQNQTTNRVDMPDLANYDNVILSWSSTGRYLSFVAVSSADNTRRFNLLDIDTGQILNATITGTPVQWSTDDAYLLVREASAVADALPIFSIYRITDSTTVNVTEKTGVDISATAWYPAQNATLGIVGVSQLSGLFGIYQYAIDSDQTTTLYETFIPNVGSNVFLWSQDGAYAVISSEPTVALASSVGQPFALYNIEVGTQNSLQISPIDYAVDITQITVR